VTQKVHDFLKEHPLKSRWLDDIISALLKKPNGTARVRDLVRELWGERDIESIEQTIYRRINDFCEDAQDWHRPARFNLFEKVEPGTYRLRSFPDRPEILELINIEFEDAAMQLTWQEFKKRASTNTQWAGATNERRLTAFAKGMQKEHWQSRYSYYRYLLSQPSGSLDELFG